MKNEELEDELLRMRDHLNEISDMYEKLSEKCDLDEYSQMVSEIQHLSKAVYILTKSIKEFLDGGEIKVDMLLGFESNRDVLGNIENMADMNQGLHDMRKMVSETRNLLSDKYAD